MLLVIIEVKRTMSYIKEKFDNLRIKIFLWLMGRENNEMWYELTKRNVTDMQMEGYAKREGHSDHFI